MFLDGVKFSFEENKVFLVTGGAAGIGAAISRALLAENAQHVVFLDISEKEGVALEAELNNKFGALRAKFIKCDITDEGELGAAFKQVLDKYRRLDVVINNAAILSTNKNLLKRMVDVNFVGTVNSTLEALEIMRIDKCGNGGTVVNITSLLAMEVNCRLPVYSATKAAVLQFSNSLSVEPPFSETKVRILTVCLGPTDTALLQKQNLENFKIGCECCFESRKIVRQRVESAATGIIDVIKTGESGSTWRVANDNPAENITEDVQRGSEMLWKSLK